MAAKAKPAPAETGRARAPSADFPRHTLEEALKVPRAIQDTNAGQPMPPLELAPAVGSSPGSSTFRDLLSSSIKYGLTAGSFNQERVSLTDLGRSILEPVTPAARSKALVDAGLRPPAFKAAYEYYRNKKIPDSPYFENALVREFNVPRERSLECAATFVGNATFLGLIRKLETGSWLSGEANPLPVTPTTSTKGEAAGEAQLDTVPPLTALPAPPPPPPAVKNAIFIGHGKNKKPLDQLKSILDQYHIPYKVATEEPNKGRPISQKVADLMNECGAAILIFTADEELRAVDSTPIWRPSENVVHELGAAAVLYGGKIVVFKEESVDFPTNFRDIGHISFPKDDLISKTHDLFKELIAFQIIKVSVGA
jgi:hypothetical protein